MRVALDVENVLANPNPAVLNTTDKLDRELLEETWFSTADEPEAFAIFQGVSDAIWRHKPEIIPPEEPNLDTYVGDIYDEVDRLDILTHREHVDEQIAWWLSEHGVVYDGFTSTDRPKWEFDYDLWIDDNPSMFNQCRTLMRYQKWNADLPISDSELCDHIHSLAEVPDYL